MSGWLGGRTPSAKRDSLMEGGASSSAISSSPDSRQNALPTSKNDTSSHWEEMINADTWEKRVCDKCKEKEYGSPVRSIPFPAAEGPGADRVKVCSHFARDWLHGTVMSSKPNTGAKFFLDFAKVEEPAAVPATEAPDAPATEVQQDAKSSGGDFVAADGIEVSSGISNEERRRQAEEDAKIKEEVGSLAGRAIWHFLHTGVTTTLYMRGAETEPGSNPPEPGGDGDDSSFVKKLNKEFGAMIEIEPHDCAKQGLKSEKYDIVLLKGDWELLTGDPWKYPKENVLPKSYGSREARQEAAKKFEEKLRREEERAVEAEHKRWTEAQRATLTAMLMYIVITEGREDLPDSLRPAPSQGGAAGGRWSWAIVMDLQIRHDEGGLERANLVIAVLDHHYLLPKIVLTPLESYEQRWTETNLRVSAKLLQDFQEVKGGSAYMAVDSIGEMASYSTAEVGLLLAGLWAACACALWKETGAGFFLLAVLCANRLEQEINFKLIVFVWKRVFGFGRKKPTTARPTPHMRANYLMVFGFGVVEAMYDDDRIPTSFGFWSAIILSVLVSMIAVPPLCFVGWVRRETNYKGPYPLTSPERQDWVRNSVGCFYGSCSECIFGGAGLGYRCADQQGGRLFNWLAACSIQNVLWTGTSNGGVHHSNNPGMDRQEWVVVG